MVCKCRSRSISLCGSRMAGLTIVLTPEHPDEKGNVKGSCPFPGPLLPLVVEDVGRIDPRSGSGRLATCCFPFSRKAQPIVEKGLGPDGFNGVVIVDPHSLIPSFVSIWSNCFYERKSVANFGVEYLAS